MELRTPVKILTGVCMGDSRTSGCVPQVNNTTGTMHGHHFHSTVTDLQTPVYSSAPKTVRTPEGVFLPSVDPIPQITCSIDMLLLNDSYPPWIQV